MTPREGETGRSEAARSFLEFLVLAMAIVIGLVALGLAPTRRLAGDDAVAAMLAGCAVSLLGSIVGTLPVMLVRSSTPARAVYVTLGSLALRLVLVLVLGMFLAWSGRFAPTPLLVWLMISYLGLLVVDTRYTLRALQSPR